MAAFDVFTNGTSLNSNVLDLKGYNSVLLTTPAVDANTATVGQVLTLTSLGGAVEFQDAAGGGGTLNSVVAGTGITVDNTDPANPVVTNSAPDQTVSLTQGGNITITGSYPNFTLAAAGNISGAGTANFVPKFTGGSVLGDSQIFNDGTNTSILSHTIINGPVGNLTPKDILKAEYASGYFAFSEGNASNTPTLSVVNSSAAGNEAAALGAGTNAAFFAYSDSGDFVLLSESKATIENGLVGGGVVNFRIQPAGNLMLGSGAPSYKLDIEGTNAVRLPRGTTAQRPVGTSGLLR